MHHSGSLSTETEVTATHNAQDGDTLCVLPCRSWRSWRFTRISILQPPQVLVDPKSREVFSFVPMTVPANSGPYTARRRDLRA